MSVTSIFKDLNVTEKPSEESFYEKRKKLQEEERKRKNAEVVRDLKNGKARKK